VAVVPEDQMVDALVEWATFINEHGLDSAFERARSTREQARREAERDRAALAGAHGDDVNRSEQRVELIRKLD
jgi:(E)-4-hydroxy-3-methylbut-2-enyl-diphosphate synthase